MAAATRSCVGIISMGDMGAGIARLLKAHGYRVVTNASDRSRSTQERAEASGAELLPSDIELCRQANYIISVAPPRDAKAIAERIRIAVSKSSVGINGAAMPAFVDLNAISPQTARDIHESLKSVEVEIPFIDGGIIGGPPKQKDDGSWSRPSIVASGPVSLRQSSGGGDGEHLAQTLNVKHISDTIGSASGLKMCFASMTKGFTAIAVQSFTTAQQLGVVGELQTHLSEFAPSLGQVANRSVPGMPPKAYRWVHEMEEIADTFQTDGGFNAEESIFHGVAKTYALVADGTELGKEKTDSRVRGKTAEDVAALMAQGTGQRKPDDL